MKNKLTIIEEFSPSSGPSAAYCDALDMVRLGHRRARYFPAYRTLLLEKADDSRGDDKLLNEANLARHVADVLVQDPKMIVRTNNTGWPYYHTDGFAKIIQAPTFGLS